MQKKKQFKNFTQDNKQNFLPSYINLSINDIYIHFISKISIDNVIIIVL